MLNIFSLRKVTKVILIGLTAATFFSGCASKVPMATSSEDSIAKSFKKDKKYANVYLCRNSFSGSALNKTVLIDGKFAGSISGYSFFHWKMKPGKHIIVQSMTETTSITLNTKSNTNYFIVEKPMTGLKAGAELFIVDEEEGKKCVLATKMLKSQLHVSAYPQLANKVKPTYVSPVKYKKYSCKQLSKEIEKISQRAAIVSGQLENINTQNAAKIFMSPLIFLPLAAFSTEEQKIELGKLSGEYNALKTVAKQKKCKFASSL